MSLDIQAKTETEVNGALVDGMFLGSKYLLKGGLDI